MPAQLPHSIISIHSKGYIFGILVFTLSQNGGSDPLMAAQWGGVACPFLHHGMGAGLGGWMANMQGTFSIFIMFLY